MQTEQFECWVILELMGRQKLAGYVTEKTIAGAGFLHITIPATTRQPEFSRLISPGSLYAINPVSETVAKIQAERLNEAPIQAWDLDAFVNKAKQLALNEQAQDTRSTPDHFDKEDEIVESDEWPEDRRED